MNTAAPRDEALLRLWEVAQGDYGGSRVCVKLLLGLYNGSRFPFDMTELRCLDDDLLDHAMVVIRADARLTAEVHEHLGRITGLRLMGRRFEVLACNWRLKGKCSREHESESRAMLAELRPVAAGGVVVATTAAAAAT